MLLQVHSRDRSCISSAGIPIVDVLAEAAHRSKRSNPAGLMRDGSTGTAAASEPGCRFAEHQ